MAPLELPGMAAVTCTVRVFWPSVMQLCSFRMTEFPPGVSAGVISSRAPHSTVEICGSQPTAASSAAVSGGPWHSVWFFPVWFFP